MCYSVSREQSCAAPSALRGCSSHIITYDATGGWGASWFGAKQELFGFDLLVWVFPAGCVPGYIVQHGLLTLCQLLVPVLFRTVAVCLLLMHGCAGDEIP